MTHARQGPAWLEVPLLVACWLLGYWAPWPETGTAWLSLAEWGTVHGAAYGYTGLERTSFIVTALVACVAVSGAVLRLMFAAGRGRSTVVGQIGLFAVCAPLSVVMTPGGAIFFLAAAGAVALAGCWKVGLPAEHLTQPLLGRLLRQTFPVLAAGCFLAMSWQYNAEWLIRGLLISGGLSLLARAALPTRHIVGI